MLSPAALALGLFASPSRRVATLAATALSAAARRRRLGVKRAGRVSFRERSGPGGTRKVFRRSALDTEWRHAKLRRCLRHEVARFEWIASF